jgi:hypothetical protein
MVAGILPERGYSDLSTFLASFLTAVSNFFHSSFRVCQKEPLGFFVQVSMIAGVTVSVPSMSIVLASGLPPLP